MSQKQTEVYAVYEHLSFFRSSYFPTWDGPVEGRNL